GAAGAGDGGEEAADLVAGEDDRQAGGPGGGPEAERAEVDLEDLFVEEDEGIEGLVLGADGNVPGDGEGGEEGLDVGGAEVGGVSGVMEEDEAAHPIDIAVLGAAGVAADAEDVADLVEEARLGGQGRGGDAWQGGQVAEGLVEDDLVEEGEGG